MVWAALAGAGIGAGLGAIFGGGKRTGTGRASVQAMDIHQRSFMRGIQNVEALGQNWLNAFKSVSPVFGALESRVLGDLDDTARTARLEQAFMGRLQSQQASRGLSRAPTAALQSSFAGLQFGEQMRQQAFGNAAQFQQQFGQPVASALFADAVPNLDGSSFALQGLAMGAGAQADQNQSIISGLGSGLGFGSYFGSLGGGGGRFQRRGNQVVFPSGGTATY